MVRSISTPKVDQLFVERLILPMADNKNVPEDSVADRPHHECERSPRKLAAICTSPTNARSAKVAPAPLLSRPSEMQRRSDLIYSPTTQRALKNSTPTKVVDIGPKGWDRLVISPHNPWMSAFNVIVAVCVLFTVISVPLEVAYKVPSFTADDARSSSIV